MAKRLASFGFALSPWQAVKYTEGPEIGKFEADRFDPRTWRTHTPNAALMEMRDDDAFWAARRIAGFSDEMIRAIVHHWRVQRSDRREGNRGHPDQTAPQDSGDVSNRGDPDRDAAARQGSAHV